MKKSLVSLLVFALVFTMVAPAFAAAETGLSDIGNSYAKEEIEALVEAGIIGGYPDGTFKPRNPITRAEFAKILALAAGLEEDAAAASVFTDVPAWAAGYVGALVNAEITKGKSETRFGSNENISRQELAVFFVRAWGLEEAAEESTLEVKFNDASSVAAWAKASVALAGEIEFINGLPNGNFDPTGNAERQAVARLGFEFFANGEEYKEAAEKVLKENQPTPDELAVEKVYADNLKEVVVEFNQAVELESATDKANYSLKSGKTVKLITLSEDETTATVTLEGTLNNNRADALNIDGVSSKDGEDVLDVKNIEFTAVDNTIPEVTAIVPLGTKALKVEFSEPVQQVQQNNFTLDGKAFFGRIDTAANYRSVVIRPYSANALEVGDHTLVVSGVKDFAGFVSLNSTHEFTVVEDKEPPTIEEATATLEYVTITFSEIVDPDTISASKVYWKSGDSKKTANSYEQLADNKYRYHFAEANFLPTGSVTIYVEGVKDYSGNEIAKDTSVTVVPVIDQTRPEVKRVEALDAKTIKVTFSKSMERNSVTERNNYTVTNRNNNVVSVQGADFVEGSTKEVLITLYGSLSTGNNTLTIKNLRDNTKLKNTMLDYSGTVTLADTSNPKISSKVKSDADRRVVIEFNKTMDIESLTDYSNYHVTIDDTRQPLTSDLADISVLQDAKVVSIQFVESFKNKRVSFVDESVSHLHILGVKDTAGNLLDEFVKQNGNTIDLTDPDLGVVKLDTYDTDYDEVYVAGLTDRKTLELKFSAGIVEARSGAFEVTGNHVTNVEVNGTSTVTLKFRDNVATDASGLSVRVNYPSLVSIAGITSGTGFQVVGQSEILDLVSPVVLGSSSDKFAVRNNNEILVPVSEQVKIIEFGSEELAANDLEVRRVRSNDKLLQAGTDYIVTPISETVLGVEHHYLLVTITDRSTEASIYTVRVKDNAQYIIDNSPAKNAISAASARETSSQVNVGAATDVNNAKRALENAISAAKNLHTNAVVGSAPGQYSQASKDALNEAIEAAETALENGSTVTHFNNAKSALDSAVDTFTDSVVKPQPAAPSVDLEPGSQTGFTKLAGSTTAMEYSTDAGTTWLEVASDDIELEVDVDDEILIRVKADTTTNTPAGAVQTLIVSAEDIA